MLGKIKIFVGSDYFLYLSPVLFRALASLLVIVPISTYFLEPRDFGLFALLMVVILPTKSLAAAGARWVIGGYYLENNEAQRASLMFNLVLFELLLRTVLIFVFVISADQLLALFVPDLRPEYIELLYIALLATWINSLWPVASFLMIVQRHARFFAITSIVQVIVNVISVMAFLWWMEMGVEALFYTLVVTNLVSLGLEMAYLYHYVKPHYSSSWMRIIWQKMLHSAPGGAAETVAAMAEKILIQFYTGLSALGLYAHSQQYQAIFKMLNGAMGNTLTPRTLEVYSKSLDPRPIQLALGAWYGVLAFLGIFVALFTDDVIELLTHGKFIDSAPLVQILFLLSYSVSHGIPYAQFLLAKKESKILMYTQLIPTFVGLLITVAALHFSGLIAAVCAIVFSNILIQASRYFFAKRLGYEAIASRLFSYSLLIYLSMTSIEYVVQPGLLLGILLCALGTGSIFWLYRFPVSLRNILSV